MTAKEFSMLLTLNKAVYMLASKFKTDDFKKAFQMFIYVCYICWFLGEEN